MERQIRQVEDLEVFRKAYQKSLEIHHQTLAFPKIEQYGGIGDQVRRASKGICASLAEGFGKQSHSKAEFKRYISIAIGSADEIRLWLSYAADLGYLTKVQVKIHRNDYQVIAKMLTGLHRNWS